MCGGTVVEDIDQYNRVHEMLSVLSGKLNRDMDDVSSMSKRWDSDEVYDAVRKNYYPQQTMNKIRPSKLLLFLP